MREPSEDATKTETGEAQSGRAADHRPQGAGSNPATRPRKWREDLAGQGTPIRGPGAPETVSLKPLSCIGMGIKGGEIDSDRLASTAARFTSVATAARPRLLVPTMTVVRPCRSTLNQMEREMRDDGFEFVSRYGTGPGPDVDTMCKGQCEGMGTYPVLDDTAPVRYAMPITSYEREQIAAEKARGTTSEDGYYFITCGECGGSGKRT